MSDNSNDTEYLDWVENNITYETVEDLTFVYEPIEEAAETNDCDPVDVVGTLLFDTGMPLMPIKEGNDRIGNGSNGDPWRYKCILSQLIKQYTIKELSEQFPVGEQTVRKHAKNQGVVGRKRTAWKVEDSWEKARKKTIERDGECVSCGMDNETHHEIFEKDLVAHHILPKRVFDEKVNAHSLDNLVALCERCHQSYEVTPRRLFLSAINGDKEL